MRLVQFDFERDRERDASAWPEGVVREAKRTQGQVKI